MAEHLVLVDPTCENVFAVCPVCGHQERFNRVTDLGTTRPIDSREVSCGNPACATKYTIGGDLINPAHEMLLYECGGMLKRKEYMQCILGLARAYEVFFSHYVHVQLIFRPVGKDRETDLAEFNELLSTLDEKLKRFTFEPRRRLFLKMNIDGCAPATFAESAALVASIPSDPRNIRKSAAEQLASLENASLRDLCVRLSKSKIDTIRNRVVHKGAYRPTHGETLETLQDGYEIIPGLARELRLHGTAEHYINGRDE